MTTPPPLRLGEHILDFDRPRILGVLNVTPDSFYDGGELFDPATAIAHGRQMVSEGADLIDVGGESTRPGAEPVSVEEELRRVLPVLEGLRDVGVPVSIDTCKPEVAATALEAGAAMINDVTGMGPEMLEVARHDNAPVIVMHMQGEPRTMQRSPSYHDVVSEVAAFLEERLAEASAVGVRVVLDPGIGFGKTLEHNLALLAHLDRLTGLGAPVLIGLSRKSFLGKITGAEVGQRLESTLAANVAAVLAGAHMVRVHDVRAHRDALAIVDRIRSARRPPHRTVLEIHGICCHGRIGATAAERSAPQELSLDVEAIVERPSHDRIASAVDYACIAATVRAVVEEKARHLLETLVSDVAAALLHSFAIQRLTVRARKPSAARDLEVEEIAVEATVER